MVDHLAARDLLERVADEHDRRVWQVRLTPSGRRISTEIAEVDVRLRNQLRSGFSKADRQLLADLLVRLQANLPT